MADEEDEELLLLTVLFSAVFAVFAAPAPDDDDDDEGGLPLSPAPEFFNFLLKLLLPLPLLPPSIFSFAGFAGNLIARTGGEPPLSTAAGSNV